MHGKLTASGVELAAEKEDRKRGRGRGSGPDHLPKKVGLDKSRLLERLAGTEADDKENDTMRDLKYCERKAGSAKPRKGLTFTLRSQT